MSEVKWRYFKIIGKADNKPKKIGVRALSKPSISEAKEICKDYLDEVNRVVETTEDLVCYIGV